MALIQHRQIADSIRNSYVPHIATNDLKTTKGNDDPNILSRGLAAYTVAYVAGADPATAGSTLTDGYHDNGIDAIYFDKAENHLYLLQSKWNTKHTGSVELGDLLKFIKGCKDLLNSRYKEFNDTIKARRKEIDEAINQASKVVCVITYSGAGTFSSECDAALNQFVDEVDETRELLSFQVINQAQLYAMLLQGAAGANISAPITLFDWGGVNEPVKAFYGQIAASDLAELHNKYGHRLFSKNIRMFLGDSTQVNNGIQSTLTEHPEIFWYLNNGITALASTVRRKAIGGATRVSGVFECEGLTIVNGAQTIGSLAAAGKKDPITIQGAKVPFRVVSLEGAPDGFASLVTRTNNTQNRIDARNFVALDPQQERLKAELAIDQIDYEYRQGEIENSGPQRLGLLEATISLACTQKEIDLSVQAKREIGKLWEDIARAPYKTLFNPNRSSEDIWDRVKAFRRIDRAINFNERSRGGKGSSIVTHGNRFIMHTVYRMLLGNAAGTNINVIKDETIDNATKFAIDKLVEAIENEYSDNYVASLFKNLTKCRRLSSIVVAQMNEFKYD